jgi:predicted Zn-dependent protease
MTFYKSAILSISLTVGIVAYSQNVAKDLEYGNQGFEMVKQQMGLCKFEPLESLVTKLGNKLVGQLEKPLFEYEFYLVDTPEPNAFALPGGKIFVTRGLLALPLTEDELAGVMGHEIIHSNNRHGVKTSAGSVFGTIISIPGVIVGGIFGGPIGTAIASPFLAGNELLQADYSRSNEKEADKEGTALAAKAGYQSIQLANILKRLSLEAEVLTGESEKKSYFASHPYTPDRVKAITKHSAKNVQSPSSPILTSDEFLKAFDGLNIGNNPEYGYVHKSVFYHPTDFYSFKLAEDWQTAITPVSLSLGSADGEAIMSFMVEEDTMTYKQYLDTFEKAMLQQSKAKPSNKEFFDWHGHKGEVLEYTSSANDQIVKFQLIAVDYGNGRVFKIAALFTESAEEKVSELLKNAQPIKSSDLPKTSVPTIKIIKAKEGETLQAIIDRSNSKEYANLMVLLNEKAMSSQFKEGQLVKAVINKPFKF